MPDKLARLHTTNQFDTEFSAAEVLLPAQFHCRGNRAITPEPLRRLMVAVLLDAVRCVQTKFDKRQSAQRQNYADARSWIFSHDDRAVFSFRAICDALDINPDVIRKYLAQWEEKRLSGEKPRRIIRRSAVSLSKRISR